MRIKKTVPLLAACIISAIINILYIADIAPEWSVRMSFIMVMVCSISMSVYTRRDKNKIQMIDPKAVVKQSPGVVNKWYVCSYIFFPLLWMASYFIAIFIK